MRSEKHLQKRSWEKHCRSRCRDEWKPKTRRTEKNTRTGAPGKVLFYSSNLHFSWKEKLLLFRLFDLIVLGSYQDLQKNNQTFYEFLSPNLRYPFPLTKKTYFNPHCNTNWSEFVNSDMLYHFVISINSLQSHLKTNSSRKLFFVAELFSVVMLMKIYINHPSYFNWLKFERNFLLVFVKEINIMQFL